MVRKRLQEAKTGKTDRQRNLAVRSYKSRGGIGGFPILVLNRIALQLFDETVKHVSFPLIFFNFRHRVSEISGF